VPTCGGEGEGEGEGAEGEGEGEGEGAEGEGEGEGAEGEGEGEGQVGIDIDFTPIYQAFVLITEQLTNNDINNDDVCDLEELACFSFILSGGVLADVNNAFVANRAQFGTDIGVEILSAIPNLDALFAAWLMLGHQTYIEGALAACEGCANPFDVNNYDVSQNATVAAATAGCNIPACAGEGEGEGEGAEGEGAEGEGEGEGEGAEGRRRG
jgi:hypothetical protein